MKKTDVIALFLSAITVLAVLGLIVNTVNIKGSKVSCAYRLKMIHLNYAILVNDDTSIYVDHGERAVSSLNTGEDSTLLRDVFDQMHQVGLSSNDMMCPDYYESKNRLSKKLYTIGYSYVVGSEESCGSALLSTDIHLNTEMNISRVNSLADKKWKPGVSDHGENGNLLFIDGSVNLSDAALWRRVASDICNKESIILLP